MTKDEILQQVAELKRVRLPGWRHQVHGLLQQLERQESTRDLERRGTEMAGRPGVRVSGRPVEDVDE